MSLVIQRKGGSERCQLYRVWQEVGTVPLGLDAVCTNLTCVVSAPPSYCLQVREDFKTVMRLIVNRRNAVNGTVYRDDPTILAWETGNELLCPPGESQPRKQSPHDRLSPIFGTSKSLMSSLPSECSPAEPPCCPVSDGLRLSPLCQSGRVTSVRRCVAWTRTT